MRIRLAVGVRMQDYLPRDEGSVMLGPRPVSGSPCYDLVRIDRDGPGSTGILFAEEEIEVID